MNCFPIWGYSVYSPDIGSTMIDEICDRIARVFNEVGADMSYFDGGEEVAVQPPHWRNQGRIALGVQSPAQEAGDPRRERPVHASGVARDQPGRPQLRPDLFRPPRLHPAIQGAESDRLGRQPAHRRRRLVCPHTGSPATDAVTPDEVMLLCLKALGGKAPISFQSDANNLWANKRMPEMLEIIRTCDELKRRNYFTEQAFAELARPMAEHLLERTASGEWDLRPLQFGPPRVADASGDASGTWVLKNPYGRQTPWVRIRARTRLAPAGVKGNLVLAGNNPGVRLPA